MGKWKRRKLNDSDKDGSQYYNLMLSDKKAAKWTCADCHWQADTRFEKHEIVVHHINGNWHNNFGWNRIVICQDCHNIRHGYGLAPARMRIVIERKQIMESGGWILSKKKRAG